jgi:hypothetical protein
MFVCLACSTCHLPLLPACFTMPTTEPRAFPEPLLPPLPPPAVSSRFFTDFFTYIKGQAPPQVISLDAVNCSALSAVSLGSYLDWVYAGALPQLDSVSA